MSAILSSVLSVLRPLGRAWTWRMAWRDSRRTRRRLLLYSSSIVLGVAALVAIGSLGNNLQQAVELQAKSLLGADLVIASRDRLSSDALAFVNSLGSVRAQEVSFSSMALFPKSGSTRLVQVRAIEPAFPFYGTLDATPNGAGETLRSDSAALVEDSLLKQFGLHVGDEIKLGDAVFHISGSLGKVPGEVMTFGTIAPRVFIDLMALKRTGLLQRESLAREKVYFKFGPEVNVSKLVERSQTQLDKFHLEADTVEHRKRELGRAMTNLYHFLNLVGFIALLAGGIAIASAIHVHIQERLPTVAILRFMGVTSIQALAIYLCQAMALSLAACLTGACLGIGIQLLLPHVLADFLPLRITPSVSWSALARGVGMGWAICALFALLPLAAIRQIPPLAVLRSGVETGRSRHRDPLVWACYAVIGGGLFAFSISQTQRWTIGAAVAGGMVGAFVVLLGIAQVLVWFLKVNLRRVGRFAWRQGLANLYRPHNRTVLLTLSLGLGTFLVLTLYLVQLNIISQLLPKRQSVRADAVLFDIQPDQKEGVVQILKSERLPVLEEAPIVTMRLVSIKGQPVGVLRKDPRHPIPNWALRREYRSTFRDHLADSETLLTGRWCEKVQANQTPIPVSVEEGIAKTLRIGLGDALEFDVQGVTVSAIVGSIRDVDWRRLQPNFFFVFPEGVLDDAPAFHVIVTHVGSSERSAQMQRAILQKFPNVSTIDLSLVLQTIDSIVGKIAFALRFMTLFTVGTGVVVLLVSLLTGRFQRLRESVLLRTLGAARRQIIEVLVVEYLSLGLLAGVTGIVLSTAASWALARFLFKIDFHLELLPLLEALFVVASLTLAAGLLVSRGVCSQPPLESLRSEG